VALSALERRQREYRRLLLLHDQAARDELHRAYAHAKDAIEARLRQLYAQGVDPDRFDAARLAELLRQIDDELLRLAAQAEAHIISGQRVTARIGAQQALGLIDVQVPGLEASFTRLPTAAFAEMVGQTSQGSPLRTILARNGSDALEAAKRSLVAAIAQGTGPREVGRELRRVLNQSAWRAEVTARNALLDAHRSAALQTYAANSDVLSGWVWTAALSSRTCLGCLALHGTEFLLTEQFFPRHPACRCTPTPRVKGMFGDQAPFESGESWLNRQSREVQRAMIPDGLWLDWESDVIRLEDFVTVQRSRTWGKSYRQATSAEAREHAARRGRRAA
jgi:SPP1 gp7 family putative phage head morphogenesis protein